MPKLPGHRCRRFLNDKGNALVFPPCLLSNVSISSRSGYSSLSPCSSNTYKLCANLRNNFQLSQPTTKHHSVSKSFSVIDQKRSASSSSSTKWLNRQKGDHFAKEAKIADLKSRAAFKLLQINDKYRILKPGMTVVDLGFAPGSWSQVAIDLVRPGLGRVVGVDIIPVAPPRGVNGIQGDFLSLETQQRVRELLRDEKAGRVHQHELIKDDRGHVSEASYLEQDMAKLSVNEKSDENLQEHSDRCVDVVLSDMSAPWEIVSGPWKRSLSNPYYRMMNTSGNKFKDHAGSMDLCRSALYFAFDTLKVGGNFVCKFYQGSEDKQLEKQLKAMFTKVHREKPESSRSESKEAFFVGVKRLASVDRGAVFDEGS